jgi:hypothetical protein
LTRSCDYRIVRAMYRLSTQIIEDFGGIAELARLVKAPASTVNSWRTRITESRLDHLKLAAAVHGKVISWDTLERTDDVRAA